MFKNLSIGQKIHLPIIVMMIVSLTIIVINGLSTIDDIKNSSFERFGKNMKIYLSNEIKQKEQIGLTNAINLSYNQKIIDALVKNNRDIAIDNLVDISKTFKKSTDYKRIKIHLHTTDGKSFIRNWNTSVYGDNLLSFRESLKDIKKLKEPFVTVENGRAGMLIRGISPVFSGDKYIGSLEFIQGFNSIARNVKKDKNFNLLFLACKNSKNIDRFNKDIIKLNGLFLSQKDAIDKNLMETLKEFDPKMFKNKGYIIKDNYFIVSLPIKDHKTQKIGCGIIAVDIKYVSKSIEQSKDSMAKQLLLIVVDMLLILILFLVLRRSLDKPVDGLISKLDDIQQSLNNNDIDKLYINNRFLDIKNDEIGKIQKTINSLLKSITKNFVKLQQNKKYTKEYLKAVDAGSIVSKSDTKGNITYVNDALCKNTGYTKEELIGKPHNIFRHSSTSRSIFKEMWNTIKSGNIYHGLFKNKRKDGSAFYANITIVPIKNENNKIIEYVALRDDVTELVNSKEELKKTFFTDPLTSFSNRFKLLDDIETNKASYLAVIDIHEFRQINDFYGHKVGDLVIVNFANRLFEHFKIDGYNVYRVHGDEFAIIAKQEYSSKKEFFNNLQNFINKNKTYNVTLEGNEINIRVTCGISYNNNNLITETELAHKTAKKQSKEILEYSDDIQTGEEYKNNLEWTNKIKEAIKDNRIKAFFQPIVNAKNDKIEKYETLMRLIEKDGKEISPFFFLDIAKKSRLYKDLTRIVVTQAFEKFADTSYEFSVNLSAEDIMQHNISEWFFELACEYKVNNQIVVELVESEGIESFDMVDTFIHNAKENGMKIAIDDFGTGYSNFEYLIKLNTDYLKIDGSLIKEIDTDEKLYSVVETMTQFAKKNDIKVIAEFIANEKLYEKIKELDIEYGQGFYLGKPMSDILK